MIQPSRNLQGSAPQMLPGINMPDPSTVAILLVLILAAPYLRHDFARLLRATADILDSPSYDDNSHEP